MPNFFTANEPEKRLGDKGRDRPAAVLIVLPQVDAEIPVLPGRRLKYVAPRLSSSARSRPNLSVQAPHPPLVTDLIQSFEPDYRAPFLAHPNRSSTRSEEHTSELQSLMRISYAVFCLKKKNKTTDHNNNTSSIKTI